MLIKTLSRTYKLDLRSKTIVGHPGFCPIPRKVVFAEVTGEDCLDPHARLLTAQGMGMGRLFVRLDQPGDWFLTSRVEKVEKVRGVVERFQKRS